MKNSGFFFWRKTPSLCQEEQDLSDPSPTSEGISGLNQPYGKNKNALRAFQMDSRRPWTTEVRSVTNTQKKSLLDGLRTKEWRMSGQASNTTINMVSAIKCSCYSLWMVYLSMQCLFDCILMVHALASTNSLLTDSLCALPVVHSTCSMQIQVASKIRKWQHWTKPKKVQEFLLLEHSATKTGRPITQEWAWPKLRQFF